MRIRGRKPFSLFKTAVPRLLATGSDDGTILVYDTKTWKTLYRLDCKAHGIGSACSCLQVDISTETEVKRVAFS